MPNFRKDVPDERGLTASSNNDTTSQHESTHELIAADSARDCLLALQSENGWWAGRSAIQIGWIARYVLVEYWMDESHSDLAVASSDWLLANDLPSGGWARWAPQSEFDLSTSVLVYLSLRLTGVEAEHPTMLNAKKSIIAAGGASRCDAFAKYYLALFGQLPWNACPPLIPEMEWLPRWLQSSPRNRSEWSRLLLLPLSVLWEKRPRKVIRREDAIRELFSPTEIPRYQNTLFESALVGLNSLRIRPFRKAALDKLTQWIETRITHRDGLAGSFDSTLISIVALISQGSSRDSQPLATAIEHVRNRIQECVVEGSGTVAEAKLHISPVCDTAMSVRALAPAAREKDEQAVRRGIEWLLHSVARFQSEGTQPGGWCREFDNSTYPNVVATALALLAMREQFAERAPSSLVADDSMVAMIRANSINLAHRQVAVLDRVAAASRRARQWLTSQQNYDGGWGHIQKLSGSAVDCRKTFGDLCVADISTPAATGHVLQALGAWEMGCGQNVVDRGVSFLRGLQCSDGGWAAFHDAGRIETTWSAIEGLRAVGLSRRDSTLADAAKWLLDQQNEDGGWSESFEASHRMQTPVFGSSCPMVTSWAILGLMAAGHRTATATQQGIDFIEQARNTSGGWTASTRSELYSLAGYRTKVSEVAYPILAWVRFGATK